MYTNINHSKYMNIYIYILIHVYIHVYMKTHSMPYLYRLYCANLTASPTIGGQFAQNNQREKTAYGHFQGGIKRSSVL